MRRVILSIFLAITISLSFAIGETGAQIVQAPIVPMDVDKVHFIGKKLYVVNSQGASEEYKVESITYSPMPVRTWMWNNQVCYWNGTKATCTGKGLYEFHTQILNNYAYDRDLPLIKILGANTVRAFHPVDTGFLAKLKQNGLMVYTGFWVTDQDFTNTQNRQKIIKDFVAYSNFLRNNIHYDVVLSLDFGPENDLRLCSWRAPSNPCTQAEKDQQARSFFTLANEAFIAAKAGHFTSRPMTVVCGNFTNGTPTYMAQPGFADDGIMTHLDYWSVATFWGNSFHNLFSEYQKTKTAKPLFVADYGVDAFYTKDPTKPHLGGFHDPNTQAIWDAKLWDEIETEYNKPNSFVIGGNLATWSDGWYKDWANLPSSAATHDYGGWANGAFQDRYANEEWWGMVEKIPAPNLSLKDTIKIRPVAIEYWKRWKD